jgi:hypothetical protein
MPLAHWRVVNRDRFLQQVAQVLSGMPKEMLGDGAVHRAIQSVFRTRFDPPDLRADEGKYR